MKYESRLILALDVTDFDKAMEIVNQTAEHVDAVKVNYPFVLACGMEAVRDLASKTNVICDFKVADIPNTNRLIVEQVKASGASGVIVQAFPGKDSVEACIKAAKGIDVFVLTEMSHPGAERYMKVMADDAARMVVEVGATGIIAPATRPEKVKHLREIVGGLKILSPGVGAQGGSAADTIRAGADYVIVGRAIYQASNPREAAEQIAKEIKEAL